MKDYLEKKVYERWPEWFEYGIKPTKPLIPMYFGLEVGDGWFDIIWNCLEDIDRMLGKRYHDTLRFEQVKEKFGGLRMYYSGVPCSVTSRMYWRVSFWWQRFVNRILSYEKRHKLYFNLIDTFIRNLIGLTSLSDRVYHRVCKAERESYKTCEQCGKAGSPNRGGWIITLCPSCRVEHEKSRGR